MRRVAVTGWGIVSCLGNDNATVCQHLQDGKSGVRFQPDYAARGFKSHVAGIPDISTEPPVPRKWRRFMADSTLHAYHAMQHAIESAHLAPESIAHPRTGILMGAGTGSLLEHATSVETLKAKGVSKVPPYTVPKVMGSTTSANLATIFGVQGLSFTASSACASSGHSIGLAADQIRWGRQDIMFAGGAEEVAWTSTMAFDAMGVLSSAYQNESASRPYDAERDGFVIAGGAGVLVLEEWEHALRRGAPIHAELTGFGFSSDGFDMVHPHARGAEQAMRMALQEAQHPVGYINTHATSTLVGDISELQAVHAVFGNDMPPISSTKGLSGHAIGAATVHEAIYGLIMLQNRFIAGCAHIDKLDPACAGFPIIQHSQEGSLQAFLSNSFGFGGTNVSLVFRRPI